MMRSSSQDALREEWWAASMKAGSIAPGGGDCVGCAADAPCGGCGTPRSDPTHKRAEWAQLVADAKPGQTEFWRTATMADAFFRADAGGSPPVARSAISLVMAARQQAVSHASALTDQSGVRLTKVAIVGSQGAIADEPDGAGGILGSPEEPAGYSSLRYPGSEYEFPGIGWEPCCCVAGGISVHFGQHTSHEHGKYKGHISLLITITFKFSWRRTTEADPVSAQGAACKMEWWEFASHQGTSQSADELPYLNPEKWTEMGTWHEQDPDATSPNVPLPSKQDKYDDAVLGARADCPTPGSKELTDTPITPHKPAYLYQFFRQSSGCPDGGQTEASDYMLIDETGKVVTDPPEGGTTAGTVKWPTPRGKIPNPGIPPRYWRKGPGATGLESRDSRYA